ncbi:NAD-binding protein [Pseudonocardia xishanensis]|uniref:NAD-binding protein n=1 Tax=Pseudonocardia xishanensis TaxID=630995 RepID=UPI0031ECECE4
MGGRGAGRHRLPRARRRREPALRIRAALIALGALLEAFMEGDLRSHLGRRRMDRTFSRLSGHVIVCGWGRVGTASRRYLRGAGRRIVVVDRDSSRLAEIDDPHVIGDVTHDESLDYRIEEISVPPDSPVAGATVGDTAIRRTTGALLPALRRPGGPFLANPDSATTLQPGMVLIALGTAEQVAALHRRVRPGDDR